MLNLLIQLGLTPAEAFDAAFDFSYMLGLFLGFTCCSLTWRIAWGY